MPIPSDSGSDAVYQDIEHLRAFFGGKLISAYPFKKPSSLIPRQVYGLFNWGEMKRAINEADLVHVYTANLFHYPFYQLIGDKPNVLTLLTAYPGNPMKTKWIKKISSIVVQSHKEQEKLNIFDINIQVIPPAIDKVPGKLEAMKSNKDLVFIMASAPWEKSQFGSKGVDMLIQLMKKYNWLKVIFIWRNILYDEMKSRLEKAGIKDQVELVNAQVDVYDYIRKAHAGILIVDDPAIVKSYPHSLLECLLSGRPIITSKNIPLSHLVESYGSGITIGPFQIQTLEKAILKLKSNYQLYSEAAMNFPVDKFSRKNFIDKHVSLYEQVLGSKLDLPGVNRD
jgi:glycosyltransferase involved in cell wall biosynthesis